MRSPSNIDTHRCCVSETRKGARIVSKSIPEHNARAQSFLGKRNFLERKNKQQTFD
jgi:hypothetical protein